MHREITRADEASNLEARLDVKALRLATHGWLLGNPLVYKPGVADLIDLTGIARQLARAGAASGTLVLGGASHDDVRAILILRLALTLSRAALGEATATAIADVTWVTFGGTCLVEEQDEQWAVLMMGESGSMEIARVSMDTVDGADLVGLRLAFDALRAVGQDAGSQPISPLLARPDWREVFLARILHALDIRLR